MFKILKIQTWKKFGFKVFRLIKFSNRKGSKLKNVQSFKKFKKNWRAKAGKPAETKEKNSGNEIKQQEIEENQRSRKPK
jgi:hypothetical protein